MELVNRYKAFNRNHDLNYRVESRNPKQPPFKISIKSKLQISKACSFLLNIIRPKHQHIPKLLLRGRKWHSTQTHIIRTETRLLSWSLPSTMSSRLTAGFRKLPLSTRAANPGRSRSMHNWKIWGLRKLNNRFTITSNQTSIDRSSKKEPITHTTQMTKEPINILTSLIGWPNFFMKLRSSSPRNVEGTKISF